MPVKHVVRQGECLSRIAADYGFRSYEPIYNDPANVEFKRKRPNPNLIYPGDVVVIPDKTPKTVSLPTGASHRVVLRRPRRTLRFKLEDADHVTMAATPCVLTVAGRSLEGQTDGTGIVEFEVPATADTASLLAGNFQWPITIAALNPITETDDDGVSGIQARLRNMGFNPGEIDGLLGPMTERALRAFQMSKGLPVNGQADAATRAKLLECHGC